MSSLLAGLSESIALTLLAVLPSFFNLASERIFEEEKALLLRAAALVALPATALAWSACGRRTRRHPAVLAFFALTLVLLIASIASIDPRTSLLGAYLKHHGLATWLALGVIFAAMCETAGSDAGRRRLLTAIVVGSVWPALYAVLQRAGIDPFAWTGRQGSMWSVNAVRSIGSFGSPNYLGGYLAAVIPLTVLRGRGTRWVWFLMPLQLAALVATESRGSAVGLVAGSGAGVAAYLYQQSKSRGFMALARAALLAAAVAALMVAIVRPAPVARFFDARSGSGRVRVLIWKGTVDILRTSGRRLWIGHGPETLHARFPPHYVAEIGALERSDAIPDRAHNETLDMAVSAGVPGVVLELGLFAVVLIGAFRVADAATGACLIAAALAHIVEIQLGIATVVSRLMFFSVAALVVGSGEVEPAAAAIASRAARRKRPSPHATAPIVDRTTTWLTMAAVAGGLSPWMGAITVQNANASPGDGSRLLEALASFSMATPLAYAAVVAVAIGVSRAIGATRRRDANGPLLLAGIAVGIVAAMPLAITPSRADIFSKSATEFEALNRWADAVVAYREAARLQPQNAYYYAGLGRALLQDAVGREAPVARARLRESRDAFDRARALDPSELDHVRHLASLDRVDASVSGDSARDAPLAHADGLFAEATGRAPGVIGLWVDWGWIDADRRRWPQALEKANHAIALAPDRVDALVLRGYIRAGQSDRDGALADYDAALSREPGNVDASRGRAALLAAR